MHELSEKLDKIFHKAKLFMYELFITRQNISREIQCHSYKIFHNVFHTITHIYVKEQTRQYDLPQSTLEAL
jgi:hypothetical protein